MSIVHAVGYLTTKLQNSTWYKCLNLSLTGSCTYVRTYIRRYPHLYRWTYICTQIPTYEKPKNYMPPASSNAGALKTKCTMQLLGRIYRWIAKTTICYITSLSTLLKSYQENKWMIMKGSLQRSTLQLCTEYYLQQESNSGTHDVNSGAVKAQQIVADWKDCV